MTKSDAATIDWLLSDDEPSVRFLTQTTLLGMSPTSAEARASRARIGRTGLAAELLAHQRPDGRWTDSPAIYTPKYLSTNWNLLALADLGMTKADPRISRSVRLWVNAFRKPDGGFGLGGKTGHLCTTGNTVRGLLEFGYEDAPVRDGLNWLVQHRAKLGGWSCWGSGRDLDSWEPLSAFAALPREKWTGEMQGAVDDALEFFLARELHVQGDHYEPWYRFHYPVHYYYDLLVGLDLVTSLGPAGDPRLRHALGVLRKKRGKDGRWKLDAEHPDVEGSTEDWFRAHPTQRPLPLRIETVGAPSKMVTLIALRVLARVDAAT